MLLFLPHLRVAPRALSRCLSDEIPLRDWADSWEHGVSDIANLTVLTSQKPFLGWLSGLSVAGGWFSFPLSSLQLVLSLMTRNWLERGWEQAIGTDFRRRSIYKGNGNWKGCTFVKLLCLSSRLNCIDPRTSLTRNWLWPQGWKS